MKRKTSLPRKQGSGYAGRRVLITGGLGFIGSTLARSLLDRGAKVRVLDSLLPQSGGTLRNVDGIQRQLEIQVEDTRDRDMVYRAVDGCDLVFHLAGPSAPGVMQSDWYSELDIACLGTLHVLDAVRVRSPGARVVIGSSHHVYARGTRAPVKETSPTDPATLFGAHRLAAEKYGVVYGAAHGVDTVIARLASVFGPRQRVKGAQRGTFAHVLDAALHGEATHVPPGAREDLLFVDDAAYALASLGLNPKARGQIVNVGSGGCVALADVAAAIAFTPAKGRRPPSVRVMRAVSAFWLDTSRLRKLGAAPKARDMSAALVQTAAWFRGTNGAV
jgi:UDP-glucose 4-epimerase